MLMHDDPAGEGAERFRQHLGKDARTLAAAEYQHPQGLARRGRRIRPVAESRDLRPDRIADQAVAHAGIAGGDLDTAARQKPVGPAEQGVLLVQHGGQAEPAGCEHGRRGGIAAEADDGARARFREHRARVEHAEPELNEPPEAARRSGPDGMHRRIPGESGAAPVGDGNRRLAARGQAGGKGACGKDVAPGAAGGDGDGAGHHNTSACPSRRRLRARTKPSAIEAANSDEPP